MPSQTGSSLDATERRQHPRHPVKSLAYLDIGPDNGGIVLNISEGGLAIHAVAVLAPEPEIGLRIQLPKSTKRLEAKGKIAWTSGSKKDAGIKFIDLPEQARLEIEDWLSAEIAPEPVRAEEVAQPEPTQSPKKRTDKWTNLVAELTSQAATAKEGIAATTGSEPLRSSVMPSPQPSDSFPSSPPPIPEPIDASDEPVAERRSDESQPAEALASELIEPPADRVEASEYHGEIHRPRNPELSLPSDTLLNTPLQPFTVLSGGGEKSKTSNGSKSVRGSAAGAQPVDDFLAKARALFSVKRDPPPAPDGTDQSNVLESKSEPDSELKFASDAAQAPVLPDPQSDLHAPSPPAPAEIRFAQDVMAGETIPKTKLTDSRSAYSKSQIALQPSRRKFALRDTMGILALCVVLAVACLGVGIAVGRRSTRQGPNTSGANGAIAMPGSGSPANNAQNVPTGNTGSQDGSASGNRHADSRRQRVTELRTSHSTGANPQSAGSDPQTSSAAPDDSNPNAQTSIAAHDAALAAPVQTSPTSGNSAAALEQSSSPAVAATVSPASRVNASPEDGVTTPTKPLAERLVPAHVIYRVEPFYPRAALEQRVEGNVRIHATVGQDGRVRNLRVVSGPALLTSAALDAAQYWRYIPSLRNGEPIETEEEISIEFHLQH